VNGFVSVSQPSVYLTDGGQHLVSLIGFHAMMRFVPYTLALLFVKNGVGHFPPGPDDAEPVVDFVSQAVMQ
jgi:hypothetical protein